MVDHQDMNDDERLSAWMDGELESGEADRLEQRLAAEPALADRLEELRAADRSAGRVYRAIDDVPMPAAVLELLEKRSAGRVDDPPAGNVIPMPLRGPRRFLRLPVAIAASVALVAGFLVHDFIRSGPAIELTGTVARNSDLYRLLETGVSGDALSLSGGEGRIVLTFEAGDGDWCRQFRLRTGGGAAQGLACRGAGGWRMEAASFAPEGGEGPYRQAADDTPPALERAVRDRLGDAAFLKSDEEKQLISNGWRKSGQ